MYCLLLHLYQSESEFTVRYWTSAAPEVVPSGVRVRVVNLPKKKNIHRDLKSAFVGVPGIRNIIPAVFGNKKTRDPVCKGFAFVDFKSEEDATRYLFFFSLSKNSSLEQKVVQLLVRHDIIPC